MARKTAADLPAPQTVDPATLQPQPPAPPERVSRSRTNSAGTLTRNGVEEHARRTAALNSSISDAILLNASICRRSLLVPAASFLAGLCSTPGSLAREPLKLVQVEVWDVRRRDDAIHAISSAMSLIGFDPLPLVVIARRSSVAVAKPSRKARWHQHRAGRRWRVRGSRQCHTDHSTPRPGRRSRCSRRGVFANRAGVGIRDKQVRSRHGNAIRSTQPRDQRGVHRCSRRGVFANRAVAVNS